MNTQQIIESWKKGEKSLDWRNLSSNKDKKEWLKACLIWSGLPKKKIASGNYLIDGNQIKSDLDFYCLVGEVFFGYRGYFGQDSHGFNDCFCEIAIFEKPIVENGAKVILKNNRIIKEIIDEVIYEYLIHTFQKYGFDLEIN